MARAHRITDMAVMVFICYHDHTARSCSTNFKQRWRSEVSTSGLVSGIRSLVGNNSVAACREAYRSFFRTCRMPAKLLEVKMTFHKASEGFDETIHRTL